ncbi:nucleolar protein [Cryptococcus wingfieldii CBS 7118]|uniref:Nucleolar protein n=1 Tax=Cryptococcus wingfieldii CBS 7118 TaxID=1295528 RepID=A0A1E3IY45_9TREE|nr:nucleolar protein [Cryptococcus wingfieldii CBS 7118]ODN93468.1 nucleolar protein [Cryptococcus wingfieldii CBS 7118]
MSTPRATRSRTATPLSVRTRSTPQASAPPSHHHKTADELALEEAASLLHTPTTARLRSTGSDEVLDGGSARALRHRRLNEVRHEGDAVRERSKSPQRDERRHSEAPSTAETEVRENDGEEKDKQATTQQGSDTGDEDDEEASMELPGMSGISEATASVAGDEEEQEDDEPVSAALSTGRIFSQPRQEVEFGEAMSASGSETASAGSSSSEAASDSDSESDSSEDSESESESDDDDQMERLLQAARDAAATKAASGNKQGEDRAEADGEVVLQFDKDQFEKKEAPIPDLSIANLPKTHLSFTKEGQAKATIPVPSVASSSAGPSKRGPTSNKSQELDDRPYEPQLSKKEKALQPRKATTSELWSRIPAPRADILPQMKRDYQALSLANSLDPKRFMKGGSKNDKAPESFAIGTMLETSRRVRDTTLTKEHKYRPGQVVQNIIRDNDMEGYAKRKYGDLQSSRMENGRGKGWQKRTKW